MSKRKFVEQLHTIGGYAFIHGQISSRYKGDLIVVDNCRFRKNKDGGFTIISYNLGTPTYYDVKEKAIAMISYIKEI